MTTFVPRAGDLPFRSNTFAVVTDAAVLDIAAGGVLFDADLDEETIAAVRERMLSRDDDDYIQRANLRTLLAAAEATELDAVGQLAVAAMKYWLGE